MAKRHPIFFSIIVTLIFQLTMNAVVVVLYYFAPRFLMQNGEFLLQGVVEAFTALVGIGTVYLFKCQKIWGERGFGFANGLGASAYFIVVSLIALGQSVFEVVVGYQGNVDRPWKIAVFVITVFLIGFTEEIFFRGVVANLFFDKYGKTPAGVWVATIASGLVFGLMHIGNILSADKVGVLVQVFAVTAMGIALSAIYYRCRNIWVLIFVHAFLDFCGAFTAGVTGGTISGEVSSYIPDQCASAVPYLIVAFILLRPKKLREILAYSQSGDTVPTKQQIAKFEVPKSDTGMIIRLVVAILIAISVGILIYGGAVYYYNN